MRVDSAARDSANSPSATSRPCVSARGEGDHLAHLLARERQPGAQRGVESRSRRRASFGHVQQRARRRHAPPTPALPSSVAERCRAPRRGRCARRCGRRRRRRRRACRARSGTAASRMRGPRDQVERRRPPPAVAASAGNASPSCRSTTRRGSRARSDSAAEARVDGARRRDLLRRPVRDERRLVDLHPLRAGGVQVAQQLRIQRRRARRAGRAVERTGSDAPSTAAGTSPARAATGRAAMPSGARLRVVRPAPSSHRGRTSSAAQISGTR